MDGLRRHQNTFSAVLLFLALQVQCSLTSRPTQTFDNSSQKLSMTEKLQNISVMSPSLSAELLRHVTSLPSTSNLQRPFSNLTKYTGTIQIMSATALNTGSFEVPNDIQENNLRVFNKIRGWLILCVILIGMAFLLVTHYLTKRRVQPKCNRCCRTFC